MEHSDTLYQLLAGLKKLSGRPVNLQIKSLDRLATLLDDKVDSTPAPFKIFFKKAYNGVKSVHDGIASDDAGEKELKELIETVRNLWDDCKKTEHKKGKDLPKDIDDEDAKETLQIMNDSDMKKEGQALLRKYAVYKKLIVGKLQGKRFKAVRAPVIAVTKNMLLADKLQKIKMSTGSFEGYPVLDKQVFVGVDMDWVSFEHERQLKPAVDYIIAQLKDRTGKQYNMMGGAKKVGTVQWVWLATDLDIKRLSACTVGSSFILKSWAFPFQGF